VAVFAADDRPQVILHSIVQKFPHLPGETALGLTQMILNNWADDQHAARIARDSPATAMAFPIEISGIPVPLLIMDVAKAGKPNFEIGDHRFPPHLENATGVRAFAHDLAHHALSAETGAYMKISVGVSPAAPDPPGERRTAICQYIKATYKTDIRPGDMEVFEESLSDLFGAAVTAREKKVDFKAFVTAYSHVRMIRSFVGTNQRGAEKYVTSPLLDAAAAHFKPADLNVAEDRLFEKCLAFAATNYKPGMYDAPNFIPDLRTLPVLGAILDPMKNLSPDAIWTYTDPRLPDATLLRFIGRFFLARQALKIPDEPQSGPGPAGTGPLPGLPGGPPLRSGMPNRGDRSDKPKT
jgi:hypothetical protein